MNEEELENAVKNIRMYVLQRNRIKETLASGTITILGEEIPLPNIIKTKLEQKEASLKIKLETEFKKLLTE